MVTRSIQNSALKYRSLRVSFSDHNVFASVATVLLYSTTSENMNVKVIPVVDVTIFVFCKFFAQGPKMNAK